VELGWERETKRVASFNRLNGWWGINAFEETENQALEGFAIAGGVWYRISCHWQRQK